MTVAVTDALAAVLGVTVVLAVLLGDTLGATLADTLSEGVELGDCVVVGVGLQASQQAPLSVALPVQSQLIGRQASSPQ